MFKALKFSNISLSRKNKKKYELWWFKTHLDIQPSEYKALSFSERQSLMAIQNAHDKVDAMKAEHRRKQRKPQVRRARVRRRRPRRR